MRALGLARRLPAWQPVTMAPDQDRQRLPWFIWACSFGVSSTVSHIV